MISRPSLTTTRLHRALRILAVALSSALVARAAVAQDSTLAPIDSAATPVATAPPAQSGPTLAGAAVAARVPRERAVSHADALAAAQDHKHHGSAVALMVVGGVAILVGIIAGGDVSTPLVLGGTVVGLIGLYQYLL